MRYYPKDSLSLSDDVPGARQLALALDQAILTYFEVFTGEAAVKAGDAWPQFFRLV